MNKLSEIPYKELSIGDKVISATGISGEIIELVPKEEGTGKENNKIAIEWENRKESFGRQYWMNAVTYLGRDVTIKIKMRDNVQCLG